MEKRIEAGNSLPLEFKNSENKTIRTVMVSDEPMFVAKDVFDVLEISWEGKKSLEQLPESWQRVGKLPTHRRGKQSFLLISEAGLYKIAFRSNKPEADRFTNWVAGEVLPQIRKTGSYSIFKTFRGVEPVIHQGKAWYNYLDVLQSLGYSRRSGSVAVRKQQFGQHFVKLFGRNFVTPNFCEYLKARFNYRQLEINFLQGNLAIGGHTL